MANKNKIRIGIGKGRGFYESVELFNFKDLEIAERFQSENIPVCQNDDIVLIKARQADLAWMLDEGHIDIAIGSSIWFKEFTSANLKAYSKLNLLKCQLCLITKENIELKNIQKICTKFVSVAEKFIDENNLSCKLIPMQGSHEIALSLGFADAIIDIVETGNTIKKMGFVKALSIYDINHEIWVRKEDAFTEDFLKNALHIEKANKYTEKSF